MSFSGFRKKNTYPKRANAYTRPSYPNPYPMPSFMPEQKITQFVPLTDLAKSALEDARFTWTDLIASRPYLNRRVPEPSLLQVSGVLDPINLIVDPETMHKRIIYARLMHLQWEALCPNLVLKRFEVSDEAVVALRAELLFYHKNRALQGYVLPFCYGAFVHGKSIFVVFEYVDGVPLKTFLERAQQQNETYLIQERLEDIGLAVRVLHDAGFAHGALDERHIICHRDGNVTLVDFTQSLLTTSKTKKREDFLRLSSDPTLLQFGDQWHWMRVLEGESLKTEVRDVGEGPSTMLTQPSENPIAGAFGTSVSITSLWEPQVNTASVGGQSQNSGFVIHAPIDASEQANKFVQDGDPPHNSVTPFNPTVGEPHNSCSTASDQVFVQAPVDHTVPNPARSTHNPPPDAQPDNQTTLKPHFATNADLLQAIWGTNPALSPATKAKEPEPTVTPPGLNPVARPDYWQGTESAANPPVNFVMGFNWKDKQPAFNPPAFNPDAHPIWDGYSPAAPVPGLLPARPPWKCAEPIAHPPGLNPVAGPRCRSNGLESEIWESSLPVKPLAPANTAAGAAGSSGAVAQYPFSFTAAPNGTVTDGR